MEKFQEKEVSCHKIKSKGSSEAPYLLGSPALPCLAGPWMARIQQCSGLQAQRSQEVPQANLCFPHQQPAPPLGEEGKGKETEFTRVINTTC